MLKILIENKLSLDLSRLVSSEVLTYITARAKGVFVDFGFAKDEIEASIGLVCKDPYDQYRKVEALHNFRKEQAFSGLFEVYKRAKGQLTKEAGATFDPSLAKEEAEKNLLTSITELEKNWQKNLDDKAYTKAFTEITALQKPLAHLFDTVKILDDDPILRENRLALLNKVFGYFEQLLDFSKIQGK